jgi:two-component system chemotaxis response regulator CheB
MSISVLLVDDSAVARQVIAQALSPAPDIRVLTTAADPIIALEKMKDEWPDVIILDIDLPRMDGITFLKKLMREHPTPIIICSALEKSSAHISIEAMSAGAVAVVNKPFDRGHLQMEELSHHLIHEVRAAQRARVGQQRRPAPPTSPAASPALSRPAPSPSCAGLHHQPHQQLAQHLAALRHRLLRYMSQPSLPPRTPPRRCWPMPCRNVRPRHA